MIYRYENFTVTMSWGERWTLSADLSQASAPIWHIDDDGEEHSTPYQTADASHNATAAAQLLVDSWDGYLGDGRIVSVVRHEVQS